MTFYERFEELCKRKKLRPQSDEIIKMTGVSSPSITGWKNGSAPKADVLARIADYFDVTVDYLLGREEEPEKTAPVDLSSLLTPQEEALIRIFEGTTEDGRLKMIQAMMNISAEEKEKKPRSDVG